MMNYQPGILVNKQVTYLIVVMFRKLKLDPQIPLLCLLEML